MVLRINNHNFSLSNFLTYNFYLKLVYNESPILSLSNMIGFRTPEWPKITYLITTKENIDIEAFIDCDIKFIDFEENFYHSTLKNLCYKYMFYLNDHVELKFSYANDNKANILFVESIEKSLLVKKLNHLIGNNSNYWADTFSLSLKLEYLSSVVLDSNRLTFNSNEFHGVYRNDSKKKCKGTFIYLFYV